MSYKTILVHLNDNRRAEALLEPAIQLATRYNSHLLGLHVYASMPAPPVPMGYASSVLGSVVAQERKQGEEIAATFSRMTANGAFVPEWHLLKVPHVDLASVVMEQAAPPTSSSPARPIRTGICLPCSTSPSGWPWKAAVRSSSFPMPAVIPKSGVTL